MPGKRDLRTKFDSQERERILAAIAAEKQKRTDGCGDPTIGFGLEELVRNCEEALSQNSAFNPRSANPAELKDRARPRVLLSAHVNWRKNLKAELSRQIISSEGFIESAPEWLDMENDSYSSSSWDGLVLWLRGVGLLRELRWNPDPAAREAACCAMELVVLTFSETVARYANDFELTVLDELALEYGEDGKPKYLRFLDPSGYHKRVFERDLANGRIHRGTFTPDQIWEAQNDANYYGHNARVSHISHQLAPPDCDFRYFEREISSYLSHLEEAHRRGIWAPSDPSPIIINREVTPREEADPDRHDFPFLFRRTIESLPDERPASTAPAELSDPPEPEIIGLGDVKLKPMGPPPRIPDPVRAEIPPRAPKTRPSPAPIPVVIGLGDVKFRPMAPPPRIPEPPRMPSAANLPEALPPPQSRKPDRAEQKPRPPRSRTVKARPIPVERGVPDYSRLRAADWPDELAQTFGVGSTIELVDLVNERRSTSGRMPVPQGSFPTNARLLSALVKEARNLGLEVEAPAPSSPSA